MSETFHKSHRLIFKKDFEYMKTESSRIREGSVLFVYKKSRLKEVKNHRLGIIVSKKNGNAVRRNKIKRVVRELYRKSLLRNLGQHYYDLLLVINIPKEVVTKEIFHHIEPLFNKVLKKLEKKW